MEVLKGISSFKPAHGISTGGQAQVRETARAKEVALRDSGCREGGGWAMCGMWYGVWMAGIWLRAARLCAVQVQASSWPGISARFASSSH
jgi:hypothetical protein